MRRKLSMLKLALAAIVIASIGAFFAFGLQHELSLAVLKARQGELAAYQQVHPLLLAGGFSLVYIPGTALSLPGAELLTLAAGAIFRLIQSPALVSLPSHISPPSATFSIPSL